MTKQFNDDELLLGMGGSVVLGGVLAVLVVCGLLLLGWLL